MRLLFLLAAWASLATASRSGEACQPCRSSSSCQALSAPVTRQLQTQNLLPWGFSTAQTVCYSGQCVPEAAEEVNSFCDRLHGKVVAEPVEAAAQQVELMRGSDQVEMQRGSQERRRMQEVPAEQQEAQQSSNSSQTRLGSVMSLPVITAGGSSSTSEALPYIPAPVSNINVADMAAQWGAANNGNNANGAPVPADLVKTPAGSPVLTDSFAAPAEVASLLQADEQQEADFASGAIAAASSSGNGAQQEIVDANASPMAAAGGSSSIKATEAALGITSFQEGDEASPSPSRSPRPHRSPKPHKSPKPSTTSPPLVGEWGPPVGGDPTVVYAQSPLNDPVMMGYLRANGITVTASSLLQTDDGATTSGFFQPVDDSPKANVLAYGKGYVELKGQTERVIPHVLNLETCARHCDADAACTHWRRCAGGDCGARLQECELMSGPVSDDVSTGGESPNTVAPAVLEQHTPSIRYIDPAQSNIIMESGTKSPTEFPKALYGCPYPAVPNGQLGQCIPPPQCNCAGGVCYGSC